MNRLKNTVIKRWNFINSKKAKGIKNQAERSLFVESQTEYLINRIEFIHKKLVQWKASCSTINCILKQIRKLITEKENSVKISTIHRAKGLEAERVFIINYNELPLKRSDQKEWEIEQERNLLYVAVTRAKSELYLIKSEKINELEEEGCLFDNLPFKTE